jgi:hypothetical protein
MSATLRASTKDYLFATWQNFLLALWCGETTTKGVREGQRVFDEHAKEFPGGLLLLTVVEEQAPMPPSDARNALGELLRSGTGKTRKSAVVYEGAGFRAAAVRSVVTGITVFSRPPFPHKIFATVADAVGFLAEPGLPATQLAKIVDEVRTRHHAGLADVATSAV